MPVTEARKLITSRDAPTQGILSRAPVLPGVEREEDWEAHRRTLLEGLAPVGAVEAELAEHVGLLFWRKRRLLRAEQPLFARLESTPQTSHTAHTSHTVDADALPAADPLNRLIRYEAHLSRELSRALKELRL